jgi:hypothetical protein
MRPLRFRSCFLTAGDKIQPEEMLNYSVAVILWALEDEELLIESAPGPDPDLVRCRD